MYKKVTAALLLSLAVFSTAACAPSAPTVTETVVSYAPPQMTADEKFLEQMHASGNPYADTVSDSSMLEIGKQACTVLDSGYTVGEMITYLINNLDFQSADQAQFVGYLIGAGVRNFCPEYMTEVKAYLNA